jgi:hypothetical protein
MNDYEFKYEAAPISEIVKVLIVKAPSVDAALIFFREIHNINGEIFSITLI